MVYGIWNNKGGVGKTFLSFILSCEYAHENPDKQVLVVDMCPQANLSEIILGGNSVGSKNLENILLKGKNRLTIGGYFDERITSPHKTTGSESSYVINVYEYNNNLPKNLWLICGDPSLEIQSQVINQIGSQDLPVDSWKNVHKWLDDLVKAGVSKISSNKKGDDTCVFIDCNPSFSSYTELAMVACDKLIVPCTSDGSSSRAISNIANLLYGVNIEEEYKQVNFSTRCEKFNLILPVVHSVVLNRSTQWDNSASKAFIAMYNAIKNKVESYKKKKSAYFKSNLYYGEVPDTHSVTIVCSHLGLPLYEVKLTQYQVHNKNPKVNSGPLNRYKQAIKDLLATIP